MSVGTFEAVKGAKTYHVKIYTADRNTAAILYAGIWAVADVQCTKAGCSFRSAIPVRTVGFDECLFQSDMTKVDVGWHQVVAFALQTKFYTSANLFVSSADAQIQGEFRTGNYFKSSPFLFTLISVSMAPLKSRPAANTGATATKAMTKENTIILRIFLSPFCLLFLQVQSFSAATGEFV